MGANHNIAVLIPCHNEAVTIGKVVDDFRTALPEAKIYVFDNCSTDDTGDVAARHGATVVVEPRKGKGYVVENMLDSVDAEYYLMVDGDDTYPAEKARELLVPVMAGKADLVVGARLHEYDDRSFRPLHVLGNKLIRGLINRIFRTRLTDILSGYRAFGRKFVRYVPIVSAGFEVETEMTVHALYYRLAILEIQVPYRGRPHGSSSKLRTFRDGFKVLWKLFNLIRDFKPLTFFGSLAILLFALGAISGAAPVYDYFALPAHQVKRFPLAILATGLMILSAGSFTLGLLLHAMNWRLKELHGVLVRQRGR